MHFDTTLNLAWLLMGLLALASTIRAQLRSGRTHQRAANWLHIVGVGLIVAALFPYISATDDVLRIQQLNTQHDTRHHPGKHRHSDDLIRLFETMDTPLVCQSPELVFTAFFVSFVTAPVVAQIHRSAPLTAGRSPPSSLSA